MTSQEIVIEKEERLVFVFTGTSHHPRHACTSAAVAGDCVIDSVEQVPWITQAPILVMEMTYIEHKVCTRINSRSML